MLDPIDRYFPLMLMAAVLLYWALTKAFPINPKEEGLRCGPPDHFWTYRLNDLKCDKRR